MNSKKNSFKRVAAGALAVLTVAAYTAPVANVGGLLNTALVANAADTVTFTIDNGAYNFVTSISDGVTSFSASQIKNTGFTHTAVTVGNTVTVKSKVPMEFNANGDELTVENKKLTESVSGSTYTYKFKAEDGKNYNAKLIKGDAVITYDKDFTDVVDVTHTLVNEEKPLSDIVVGDTVKLSSAKPFTAVIDPNSTDNYVDVLEPDTKFADGKYYVEFKMPESENNVKFEISKLDEKCTYTVSGNKILVSTESGTITNSVAASLVVKSYDANDEKGTEVADGAQVANGKKVVVTTSDENDFVKIKSFKITRAGKEINQANYTEPGEYVATFVVLGKDEKGDYSKELTITRKFTIAAKEALKAEDVTLTFTVLDADGNSVVLDGEGNPATVIDDDDNEIPAPLGTAKGKTDGIAQINLTEAQTKIADEFTVEPVFAGLNFVKGEDYDIVNSVSGSTLDSTYTLKVKIYNPEFGGSKTTPKTFTVKWRVNSYGAQPVWKDGVNVEVPVEQINTLKSKINESIAQNEASKKLVSKLTYKYVEGVGAAAGQEELDEVKNGLPTASGKYTVYAYSNGELVSHISVFINSDSAYYEINSANLKYTYGDKLDFTNFVLKDKDGKTISGVDVETAQFTIFKTSDADEDGKADKDKETGRYLPGGKSITVSAQGNFIEEELTNLPAGYYVVELKSGKTSGSSKYSLAGKQQILKVYKKAITADMIVLEPQAYEEDNTYNPVKLYKDVKIKDAKTGDIIGLQVTEGATQSEIGNYTATVKLSNAAKYEDVNANYTCSVKAAWSVIPEYEIANATGTSDNYKTGLAWDNDMTTLYNNGRIHVELKRAVNSKFTDIDGKKVTCKEFGIVYDKTGKYAAPAEYDNQAAAAKEVEKTLLIGNNGAKVGGYTEKTELKASSNTRYKANIKVQDVDTGIWARPYVIVENADKSTMIVYGETRYLNLQEEANELLELQMPVDQNGYAVRRADLKNVDPGDPKIKGGFNPFTNKSYLYASFKDLEESGFSDLLEVKDFGVVVDKNGTLMSQAIESGDFSEDFLEKNLKVDTKGLTVGHYDKNNSKLGVNEYAANVDTSSNPMMPIFARPYVDLGNGLIVYGPVEEVPTASSCEAFATHPYDEGTVENVPEIEATLSDGSYSLDVERPYIPENVFRPDGKAATVELVKYGVVVNKSFMTKDEITKIHTSGNISLMYKTWMDAETSLILGKGFIEGKTTSGVYSGKLTPKTDVVALARSYAVYKVDGQLVTVYGDIEPLVKHIPNFTLFDFD